VSARFREFLAAPLGGSLWEKNLGSSKTNAQSKTLELKKFSSFPFYAGVPVFLHHLWAMSVICQNPTNRSLNHYEQVRIK
jgi:hypothetical protein